MTAFTDVGPTAADSGGRRGPLLTVRAWHPVVNLRGAVRTRADGRYSFHTIKPAPYQVPA